MNKLLPQYDTLLFCQVWEKADDFIEDYQNVGIPTTISEDSANTLFYLLYAKYGNNPIANRDITQFKYKIMSTIFQYGPTWEKKLEIQEKLREIPYEELDVGGKAIYNSALNPSTVPSTGSLEELTYINSQNTTNYKKSKMDAYSQLWNLLATDVTSEFINRFKVCFKQFVRPEKQFIFVSDSEEDDD